MLQKYKNIGSIVSILLLLITACSCSNEEVDLSFIPSTEQVDMSDYIGVEDNHCFRLIKLYEMDRLIKEGGSGIFYLGHTSCSYCQSIVRYLNQAGMDAGVTIYYIDCYDEDQPVYTDENMQLYIDDLYTTLREEDGERVVYTPQVFTIINGIVKESLIAAKDWDVADPTEAQKAKLIKEYTRMFKPFMN